MPAGPGPDDTVWLRNATFELTDEGDWVAWVDPLQGDQATEPLLAVRGSVDDVRQRLMRRTLDAIEAMDARGESFLQLTAESLLAKDIPDLTWPPVDGYHRSLGFLEDQGKEYLRRPRGFWKSQAVGNLLSKTTPEETMGANTVEITDQNFEEQVLKSGKPVLIDFWADWCGPCHMVAPVIEEIAAEQKEKLVVGKLDVDNNPETSRKYGILSIPSMLLFVDGVEKVRLVGARGKAQILSELQPHIGQTVG